MSKTDMPVEAFWARVDDSAGPRACHPWTGGKANCGYGLLTFGGGKRMRATRVAWQLRRGPIPDGLHVLHHCDNPACCNLSHLFLGTPADNALDRSRKNRSAKGAKISSTRLTEAQIGEIRQICAVHTAYGTKTALAKRFGVTRNYVYELTVGRRTDKRL